MARIASSARDCPHISSADVDELVTRINADLTVMAGTQQKFRIGTGAAVGAAGAGMVVLAVLPFTPVTMAVAATGTAGVTAVASTGHRLKRRKTVKKILNHVTAQLDDAPFDMRVVWAGPGRFDIVIRDEARKDAAFSADALGGHHDGLDASNLDAAMF